MTLLDANEKSNSNEIGDDTSYIFYKIEDSFGIDLGDYQDLAGIRVGSLAEKISVLAKFPNENSCLSATAFFRLRRALVEEFGFNQKLIHPSTRLGDVIPWRSRKARWLKLEVSLKTDLPRLGLPLWFFWPILLSSLALLIRFRPHSATFPNIFWFFAGIILLPMICYHLLSPLARFFPDDCKTVGELANALLLQNYSAFAKLHGSSIKRGIMPVLRRIIAHGAGVKPEDIHDFTRIPSDLEIF